MTKLALKMPLWLLADDPDVVLIYAGINDLSRENAEVPEATKWAFRAAVWGTKILRPNADIVLAKIAPYASSDASTGALNAFIQDEFDGTDVAVVDEHSLFLDGSGLPLASAYSNGINHPTNAAYRGMADRWFAALHPILDRRGMCGAANE